MFTKQLTKLTTILFTLAALFLLFTITRAEIESTVTHHSYEGVPLGDVIQVDASYSHTCALTSFGGVKCWGSNWAGQLGDGTTTKRLSAVDVVGLQSGVTAVFTGYESTCALTSSGGVKCWGYNQSGKLGDGTTTNRSTPVDVVGLQSGISAISIAALHTCALTSSGGVKCWGSNYGRLGDGTENQSSVPVDVVGLQSGMAAVFTGLDSTCALTTGGGIKCWGGGFLGNGDSQNSTVPVDVVGLQSGVSTIAIGELTKCAVTSVGGVKCWGINYNGQLGDGTTTDRPTPVDVIGLQSGITAISVQRQYTCALSTLGAVKCWGLNENGQLGDGTTTNRSTPVDVVGLQSGVTSMQMGKSPASFYTCALASTGGVKCWGSNSAGTLGNGNATDSSTPVDVVSLQSGVTNIWTGSGHTCALMSTGGVKCWGNNNGRLGDGTENQSSVPVDVLVEVTSTQTATATSTPSITPTPTRTTEQTVTPDPTPTVTLTPTPKAEKVVIFIPGIAGSQLIRKVDFLPNQYVWPIFRDGPKGKMSLKPGQRDDNIYTDDAIRNYDAFNISWDIDTPWGNPHNPVYGNFIDRLISNGYVEYDTKGDQGKRRASGCDTSQVDATLFVFPWDWRFGAIDAVTIDGDKDSDLSLTPNNTNLLKEYVQCIHRIHPDAEITLISHSMGWFVGRTYVLQNPGIHNISRHIAIAPPRLGAPQAIAMMFTGDWIPELISKDLTRTLLEHFPGAHQLLPSKVVPNVKTKN